MNPHLSLLLLVSGLALGACAGSPATPAAAAQPSASAPVATPTPSVAVAPVVAPAPMAATPAVVATVPVAIPANPVVVPAKIDFAQQAQPFFEYYCYQCHGHGRQSGGLRLDVKASALRFIIPGNPARSDVYTALTRYLAASDHMPPATQEQPGDDEIALIKQWITEGANWPDSPSSP